MDIRPTTLTDAYTLHPKVYGDERGYFFESFSQRKLEEVFPINNFVQDNESKSNRGTLRGLHFQRPPATQAKIVRVVKGKVQDVIVDVRKGSPTYGKWESFILSEENKMQLYVPRGFAHGMLTLEDNTIFSYKTDNYYTVELDGGIRFSDPDLAITWEMPTEEIQANERDRNQPTLANFSANNPFVYGEI